MIELSRLTRRLNPWAYSLVAHLLLAALLVELMLPAATPERERVVQVELVTLLEGDDGDEGEVEQETTEPEEEPAVEAPEPEDPQATVPTESQPPPPAPEPKPEPASPQEPTPEELMALLFPEGSSRRPPRPAPEGVHGDPDSQRLFAGLLAPAERQGLDDPFGARTAAGRRAGVKAHGGTPGSESAVESGLEWLARHASHPGGGWRAAGFVGDCPRSDSCGGAGYRTYDIGVTGLATLAFLGAGYHHRQDRHGNTVHAALAYLIQNQRSDGCFGEGAGNMYNQSIATLVLAEAYVLTGDEMLRRPLQQGARYLAACQEPGGGWDYSPRGRDERNDVSITGWAVMALHGAQLAGVSIPDSVGRRARAFVARMTAEDGSVTYADAGQLAFRNSRGLVPVGTFVLLLLGEDPGDPRIQAQAEILRRHPPHWDETGSVDNSMYYWYYGTLATFFLGEEPFRAWNEPLLETLVKHQRRSGHAAGSWDPAGKWGRHGGRVYATALSVLDLEIYYRYRPTYLRRGLARPPLPVGDR